MKAYICPNDLNRVYGHRSIGLPYDHYTYDSVLESTVAVILLQAKIAFIPHMCVSVIGDSKDFFFVGISFYFKGETVLLKGAEKPVHGLMVRWPVSGRDCYEASCLAKTGNIHCAIVTPKTINEWKRNGVL